MSMAMSLAARPVTRLERSRTFAAASAEGATYAAPTLTDATDRLPAWLSSAYPMVPLPLVTAWITPDVPCAPSPPLVGQRLAGSGVQAPLPALLSQSVKFLVVPESSERCTGTIRSPGRFTPGLSPLIAASFHLVIFPSKINDAVFADSCSLSTPERL